jgi:DNA-binding XRE family transcriptional regulator
VKVLFRCNYCLRITDKFEYQFYTSYGHGRVGRLKPKAYCYKCHSPIYDNVDPSRDVLCAICVQISAIGFSSASKLKGKSEDLEAYRKSKGYSKRTMAEILGISRQHYHRMEKGLNMLNKKALRLLKKTEM